MAEMAVATAESAKTTVATIETVVATADSAVAMAVSAFPFSAAYGDMELGPKSLGLKDLVDQLKEMREEREARAESLIGQTAKCLRHREQRAWVRARVQNMFHTNSF